MTWADRVRSMSHVQRAADGRPHALDYRTPEREAPAARPRYPTLAWAEILVLTAVFIFVAVLGLAGLLYFVASFIY